MYQQLTLLSPQVPVHCPPDAWTSPHTSLKSGAPFRPPQHIDLLSPQVPVHYHYHGQTYISSFVFCEQKNFTIYNDLQYIPPRTRPRTSRQFAHSAASCAGTGEGRSWSFPRPPWLQRSSRCRTHFYGLVALSLSLSLSQSVVDNTVKSKIKIESIQQQT